MFSSRGYTFIELVIVSAIIAILASAIMPLATVTLRRQREIELRRNLREIRTAIDRFKDAADQGTIQPMALDPSDEGYPPDLATLVDGVPGAAAGASDEAGERRLRFLRRIPVDPMTRTPEWGLRSYQDRPGANQWGGQNVYDVYTRNDGVALDGTRYRDW